MANSIEIQRIQKIAWDLRADIVQMIGVGKAGHLGGSCSLAEIVAALYFAKMRFDPKVLADPNRDRFLLSKGHSRSDSIRSAGGTGRRFRGKRWAK